MDKENLEDKIFLDSLGLLDKKETGKFNSAIKHSTDKHKKEASDYNNLVSLFPKLLNRLAENISPSEKIKDKLLEKIKAGKSPDENNKKNNFDFIYKDTDDWIEHPVDGIKVKQLAVNKEKGYVMLLMKVAAGTLYPPHHHHGAEECYVIEGDLYAEGKILGPGDFHHAEGGSNHEPLHTKNGCTLLLVIDPKDF